MTRLEDAIRLAKEATNGWACYAKRQVEHDEIARLHRDIAKLSANREPQPLHPRHPYGEPGTEYLPETCDHYDASGRRALTCKGCALFAINRLVSALLEPPAHKTILEQFDFSVAGVHLLDGPRPNYEHYDKAEWHTRGISQGLKIARTILEEVLKVALREPPAQEKACTNGHIWSSDDCAYREGEWDWRCDCGGLSRDFPPDAIERVALREPPEGKQEEKK